jgi:Protein of unknown function (DUF3365)
MVQCVHPGGDCVKILSWCHSGSALACRRGALGVLIACTLVGMQQSAVVQAQSAAVDLPDLEVRLAGAREATKTYSQKLKTELAAALKAGSAKSAIEACRMSAPELNATVSEETGFEIGRTALRVRNPENVPDTWEIAMLERFSKQLASGADQKTLEAYDVSVTKEGQKLFRYMRPIMMVESCLACHGGAVAQDVRSEIARIYPEDKAVGFNIGDLRGAFTLIQEIE